MAASANRIVPYNGMTIDDCAARIRNAMYMLRWTSREMPGMFTASVPMSLLSWGEEITIRLYQDCFSIESKCAMPLTLIDWGKNQKNIDQFLAAFYA
jgi:hypothetical protein